ncbi:MAG: aldo/keto reductase [bacterium]|nr:aldo/keto reductase [bacterium]
MSKPDMTYRPLGHSGLQVSALSLGGWTTYGGSVQDQALIESILKAAFDAGINFFDSADIYEKGECEKVMGKVLRQFPRHELVISSKVFFPMSDDVNDRGLSRKHIMESVHRSLKRMGVEYLDLYFCHRPDPNTPLEETARAMDDLVHQGKVLYWGTSQWSAEQLRAVNELCNERNLYRPQVEQPQYSLLVRHIIDGGVRQAAADYGMGMVTWSPLASGFLTGKYDEGIPTDSRLAKIDFIRERWYKPEFVEQVRRMKPLADEAGCTRAQLALAWTLNQPGVSSVITGATRIDQLRDNLKALEVDVTSDLERRLLELFPVPKH